MFKYHEQIQQNIGGRQHDRTITATGRIEQSTK